MKNYLLALFVVSWPVGVAYQPVPCVGKEPKEVVCAKPVQQRKEREFKSEEAANEFAAALMDSKVPNVTIAKK